MKSLALISLAYAVTTITPAHALAVPTPVVELAWEDGALEPRQASSTTRVADAACTNGPNTRACWKAGFSIATDFDKKLPPEGKTVTYDLEITNTTMAPDGHERLIMAINGQYPGPTLYADWGDTMIVNVKNSLQHNGTSIHWHGLRQLNSCQHDGVNGVTECPIAPGSTKQYVIRCTQFGTSWYHSHFSAQYGDGIVGAIVINGPASGNYDLDSGTLTITDWYHETAFALNNQAMHSTRGPPTPVGGLINGTMKTDSGGAYHVTKFTKGKRHRLRLINTGIDNIFHVSIDNHNFTVITSDFVPIKPYTTNSVAIGIGQRYDIIVNANQAVGNYWLRADVGTACGGNAKPNNILSIIRYEGASFDEPTSTNTITKSTACYDESVTPYVSNIVPNDEFESAMRSFTMDFNRTTTADGGALVQWLINGSDIRVNWQHPTLQNVLDGNYTFEAKTNVFEIDRPANAWTFWVIQTDQSDTVRLPHPIHLHGHDFYILSSGSGLFNGDKSGLKFTNPSRRDTATLPAGGYLIVAFPADNPGLWLMHCHIPWHVGQGLSMQFLERKEEIIGALGDLGDYEETCDSWRSWWNSNESIYEMDDSGL
ncbi:Laccase-3 [Pseudocercospora fuligena]|uniref:laccase n=1 Tax=Pseudocercospora fuligena TaxID=685502 RepID=A0A8H6R8H6_9PEZI|nr:Laccase-3 [Pseudocercospora fuligena]